MVNDLNVVLLTGRLTRDPDAKETKSGTPITSFSIAVNRYFRYDAGGWGEETSFVEVETWSVLAKQCSELTRGQVVRVQGRIKQDRWQDGDGNNRTKMVVVAERVEWRKPKADEPEAPAAAQKD